MRDIELRLTADLDSATKEVAGFRKEYGEMVKVVEKPLRQINSFRDLESNVEQTGKSMRDMRTRVRELAAELVKADVPSRQLQESYKASVRELQRLERVEAAQANQLSLMGAGLRSAGVDTRNLAAEQARLSAEYNKALAAGRANSSLNNAKSALGAGSVRETQLELVNLRQQYALLKSSGEVSARDLGIAQDTYRRKVTESLAKLRELRSVSATPVKAVPVLANTERDNLGLTRLRALRLELATVTADYQRLTRSGVLSAQERAVAENQYRLKVEQSRKAIAALAGEQQRAKSTSAGGSSGLSENLTLAAGGASTIAIAAAYLKTTDSAKKMDAQLKLTTSSQREFNEAQRATFEIAQRNQAPLADVVTLYSRLQPAMAQMGRGQKDTLSIIDAVTQSLRISGATASETSSTITQFSQALGSGVLRGEEFNSIAENSPRLLRALAEGLKVPTGALRQMASDGQLTADVIVDTLLGQLPKLAAEAAQLPETFGGALTKFNNQLAVSVKQFDEWAGLSEDAIELAKGLTAALKGLSSGEFGDFFRSSKQSVAGFNNEISVTMARIRDLQNVRSRLSKTDSNDSALFQWKFWDRAEIDAEVAALKKHVSEMSGERDKLANDQAGSNAEQDRLAAERLASAQKSAADLKAVQTKLVADTKQAIKDQVGAERAAAGELKKAKDAQLETQAKYKKALEALNSTASGEPSYSTAQDLKVGARKALANGDIEGAKRQANAALEVLQKLADSGENTYGFGGFIKELQGIETAADGINVKKAEDSLEQAKQKTADLKAELESLKAVVITPTLSDEAVSKILKQVQDLKVKIGQEFAVPIAVTPTSEMQTIAGQSPTVKFPAAAEALPAGENLVDQLRRSIERKDAASLAGTNASPASVEVSPEISTDATADIAKQISDQGEVSVPVTPYLSAGQDSFDVPVVPQVDQASADAAQNQIAAVAERMRKDLTVPVTVVAADGTTSTPAVNTGLPAFASGDMVRGPGTGTSDSILARLSNGEFVVRAAAVQHYGPELLRRINQRTLPAFAAGGEVGQRRMPDIPAPAQSIMQQLNPPKAESMGSFTFNLAGESYEMQASPQDFQRMVRNQRLKFGKS
jgi:tape measure domain-containing protein